MKRTVSTGTDARRRVDRLRALRGSPAALREHVLSILADEGSPDILRLALESLGELVQMSDRPELLSVFSYFSENGPKRDPVGTVRVEVLKALWHLRSRDDRELAAAAVRTFEPGFNSNGELIRAAGLAVMGAIDPETAALMAAQILGSGDANQFNGEPSLTAVRLLASLEERSALLLFALGPPSQPELAAEALRSLAGIPMEFLAGLIQSASKSEDETILVGLADLIVQLPPAPETLAAARGLLRDAPLPELYEFFVSSVVASRRQDLLALVLEALPSEMSAKRLQGARNALELAPRSPELEQAITDLDARLRKLEPPRR